MINEKLKQHILGKPHKFAFRISKEQLGKANAEQRIIPMTFGAPYYVERWYGILVLNFASECVKLERWKAGAPYFMDHNPGDQRGIILNGDLVNSILRGDTKFSQSERGKELYQDVIDEIRPFTSMGFDILDIREMKPEEMPDDLKNKCVENECSAFAIDLWAPYEGSSVPLGANPNVGVEYDYLDGDKVEEIFSMAEQFGISKFPKTFTEQFGMQNNNSKPNITIKEKEDTMSDVKTKTPEELAEAKKKHKAALLKFGADYKERVPGGEQYIEKLASDSIEMFLETEGEEKVDRVFRGALFTDIKDKERRENPASFVGMKEKDFSQYSMMKVIRHLVGQPLPGEELGIEKEIHQQIVKNGASMIRDGIKIPFDFHSRKIEFNAELEHLLARNGIRTERFDQTVGSTTGGGYLVGTQHRPQDFIELYLNTLIQGFTYLPGLQQNVDIPKMTGGASISVAASEAAGFAETSLTFGQLALSPKELGNYIDITRKLLVQSTPAIDNLVSIMLFKALALKTNLLAINGSGASGEPTGIINTDNIGTFDGSGIGRPGALNAEADIRSSNVAGALNWLCAAAVAELLKGRDQTSGYGQWLMKDDNSMIGYQSQVTEQMPASALILLQPAEVVVASFGNMEILYDRSTLVTSGGLRIAVYDLIDTGLKHPGAVSYASSVS